MSPDEVAAYRARCLASDIPEDAIDEFVEDEIERRVARAAQELLDRIVAAAAGA